MVRRAFVVGALIVASGCGGEVPPFEELPLRDGLMADSSALASLPPEARARLAARFEEERTRPTSALAVLAATGAEAAAREVDGARERLGQDALVAYTIEGGRAVAFSLPVAEGERPARSVVVEGEPPRDTEALELRALEGRAGRIVEALRESAHASHVVRVSAWPAGVVVIGDTVYVNGAWLTALAPEPRGAAVDPYAPAPRGTTPVPGVFTNQDNESDAGTMGDAATTPTPPPSTSPSSGCGCSSCGCSDCNCSDCNDSSCNLNPNCNNSRPETGCKSPSCGSGSGSRTCSVARPASAAWGVSRLLAMLAPLAGLLALSRRRG